MPDIALLFYEKFPSRNNMGGRCIVLRESVGVYRLGRSAEDGTSPPFEIDIQSSVWSRQAARQTIYWNSYSHAWEITDSGANRRGQVIINPLETRVNGELISRNSKGHPDPVSIGPGDRLLLGRDDCRVYVLPECDTTVETSEDVFNEGPWGIGTENALVVADEPSDYTVSTPLAQEAIAIFEYSRGAARETADGLTNPQTTVRTIISLLLVFSFSVLGIVGVWVWRGGELPGRVERVENGAIN